MNAKQYHLSKRIWIAWLFFQFNEMYRIAATKKTGQRLGAQPEWNVLRGCGNPQPRSKQAAYSVPPT
jgi:hypothetical protein